VLQEEKSTEEFNLPLVKIRTSSYLQKSLAIARLFFYIYLNQCLVI
jgi:hypothetical protein